MFLVFICGQDLRIVLVEPEHFRLLHEQIPGDFEVFRRFGCCHCQGVQRIETFGEFRLQSLFRHFSIGKKHLRRLGIQSGSLFIREAKRLLSEEPYRFPLAMLTVETVYHHKQVDVQLFIAR